METPSSIRRLTRSQASAASQKTKQVGDRVSLLDISNDSPIVGIAAAAMGEKTPGSLVRNRGVGKETPGSGESLLRGQVKNLLQQVEEEEGKVVSQICAGERPPVWVTMGNPVYSGHQMALTPANTPQIASEIVEDALQEELQAINRALLFDSPGKSEMSKDSDTSNSDHSTAAKSGNDSSSVWSLQVNASIKEYEEDCEEVEAEDDVYYDGDDYLEVEDDEECYDDLCDFLTKMTVEEKVGLPAFEGKHTRFIYNEDGEIEGEEEVGEKVVSPEKLVLKGLPVPEGKHVRFEEDEE